MFGGLIAGALGGGAQAVSGLADQVIKEAQLAKEQAYKEGLLKWDLEEKRKDAETLREFTVGNTVLASQLSAEEAEKGRAFESAENEKKIEAQLKVARIGAEAKEDTDKFPKPVKIGEEVVGLTGAKREIFGVPMSDGKGGMYYADPLTMKPLSVGNQSTSTGGFDPKAAGDFAVSQAGKNDPSPTQKAAPPEVKKPPQPMYRDGRGAPAQTMYRDGRGG